VGLTTDDVNSDDNIEMAECGVLTCRAIIPLDSKSCPKCGVSFSGVAQEDMGECGACGSLVPIDSKTCPDCGVHFVMDDLITALSTWMKDEDMTILDLFGSIDTDSDETLTSDEIKSALKSRNLAFLGADELDRFLIQIDLNKDGVISYPELAAALSMPWTPPSELKVLEPGESEEEADEESVDEVEEEEAEEETQEETEEVADESKDAGPRYTEHVLERVMKTYRITDREGFLAHASTFDKDGNSFLKELELTEAAKTWKSATDSAEKEVEEETQEEVEEEAEEEVEEEAEEEVEEEAEEEVEEEAEEEVEEEAEEEVEEDTQEEEVEEEAQEEAKEEAEEEAKEEAGEEAEEVEEVADEDDGGDLPFKDIDSDEDQFTEDVEDSKAKLITSDGPAQWQRFMMRHYENMFPILYTLGALFIGIWIVNGMGLIVDGSGGNIAYNGDMPHQVLGENEQGWTTVVDVIEVNEIYPCDNDIQVGGCKNSLTPFAGEKGASSMPAGFYWDGIMFMILGLIGMGGIAFLQMKIKEMRVQYRRKKTTEGEDTEDESEPAKADEKSSESDDDDDDEDDDDEDDDDDDEDDDDDDEDDDDDDDDDDDEGIDVGDRVGVELEDGEEGYGEIIEFIEEDDDEYVVVKLDNGEEVEVDFDSLFMAEDD